MTGDPPADPPADRPEKGWLHYVGVALSGALLLLVIALAVMVIVVPKVAGGVPLTVLTSSMKPGLPPGTLIVIGPVDPNDIVIGDVVTYQIRSGHPDVITHRITSIVSSSDGSRTFILKGDNNGSEDDPVLAEQVQGRLWYSVPFIGYVNNAVNGANKAWIVPVGAVLLFSYAGFMIAGGAIGALRKRRHKALAEPLVATDTDAGADDGVATDVDDSLTASTTNGQPPARP